VPRRTATTLGHRDHDQVKVGSGPPLRGSSAPEPHEQHQLRDVRYLGKVIERVEMVVIPAENAIYIERS
jgi:hypothetical protein